MDVGTSETGSTSVNEESTDSTSATEGASITEDTLRYPPLTKLAKAVLIIPHGNVDVERIFSHMGLNKTKVRNSLNVDTLTALLRMLNVKEVCHSFEPTTSMVEKCRNAMTSLQATD